MKRRIFILLTLILSTLLIGASHARDIFVPFVTSGTQVQIASVAPYAAAPACVTHDPTAYHGLWNDVDGCHYDHTHNVNPLAAEVVAIFGDYTAYTGQEVSYPWQTFAGAAPGLAQPPANAVYENFAKHNGYKFDFYDFPESQYGCPSTLDGIKSVPNAWLIERHSLGHKPDFMARVHSVWAAVRFCIPGQPGQVAWLYTGGWQDFGQRIAPYQGNLFPIPGSPSPAYQSSRAPYIAHNCINHIECRGGDTASNTTWISFAQMIPGHRLFGFGFRSSDSQQKIDAANGFNTPDPTFVYLCKDAQGNYVAAGCKFNHSTGHTYQITGDIPTAYDLLDGANDGRVNYEGYTDRWGNIVSGCTVATLDCVPVKMVNLPEGKYHINIAAYGVPPGSNPFVGLPEFDIYFAGQPSGWLGSEN